MFVLAVLKNAIVERKKIMKYIFFEEQINNVIITVDLVVVREQHLIDKNRATSF